MRYSGGAWGGASGSTRLWGILAQAILSFFMFAAPVPASAQLTQVPNKMLPWWENRALDDLGQTHFLTADDACRNQHASLNPGATYQAPGRVSETVFGCAWDMNSPGANSKIPTLVYLTCYWDYRLVGGMCIRGGEHASHCDCSATGGTPKTAGLAASVGHPISMVDGAKIKDVTDYASADGLFRLDRHYRSLQGRDIGILSTGQTPGFGDYWHGLIPGNMFAINTGGHMPDFEFKTSTAGVIKFFADSDTNHSVWTFAASQGTRVRMSMVSVPASDRVTYFKDDAAVPGGPGEVRLDYGDGSYILFRRVGTFAEYRRLVPIEQGFPTGYKLFFDYVGTATRPSVVRNSFNRQMALTWTAPANSDSTASYPERDILTEVVLPDSTKLVYQYGFARQSSGVSVQDRLDRVERRKADGTVLWARGYLYEDTRFPYALTGEVDQTAARLATYAYNGAALASSTELAGGVDKYQVGYTEDATYFEYFRATVENPLGRISAYTYFRKWASDYITPVLLDIVSPASTNAPADTKTFNYYNYDYTRYGVSAAVDANGNLTQYGIDYPNHRPTSITEAAWTGAARTTSITWDSTRDIPVSEVRTGLTVSHSYGTAGEVLTRTETDTTSQTVPYSTNGQARTWTYTWTAGGKLASENGPKPAVGGQDDLTTYAYDTGGNLTSITNGLSQVTSFAGYDANGRPGTMTDANGIVTAFVYDLLGRTSSVTVQHPSNSALNAVTSFDYDIEGRVVGITRPLTEKLIMDYDLAGRLTAIRNTSGDRIDYTMNAMGGILTETVKTAASAIRNTVTRTFDELNRMLTETLGPSRTTTWAYDKNGNAVQQVSPRSNTTTFAFDGLDRLVSTVAPAAGTTTDAYDVHDNRTSHTDAVSVTTSFVRNGFGEVIREVSPDRGTSTYYYDEAGDRIAAIDGRGQRVDFTRDMLGRILTRTPAGVSGQAITYAYDTGGISGGYGIGHLATVTDPSGTTAFKYDHRGNMVIKRQAIGTTSSADLAYAYDLADRIVQITYPSGRIVNYVRDGKGRVTSVTTQATSSSSAVTLASSMAYEPYGALKSLNYGNGLTLTQDWGTDARLVSKAVRRADTSVVWGASYTYDNDDNVASVTDLATPANVVSYDYDQASRLSRATGTFGTTQQYDYAFDANGNRTRAETRSVAGQPSPTTATDYTRTSGTNRLASSSGSVARTYSYDGRGNLDGEVRGGVTATPGYDAHGRLASYTRTGDPSQANVYNGLEDRVEVTSGSSVRRYLYDGMGRLLGDYGASASDVEGEFVWLLPEAANDNSTGLLGDGDDGAGGWAPLAVMTGAGTSTVIQWLHGDRLGTPVATTDASGAAATPGTYAELAFPGQMKTFADLHYNRWRDYDPSTGRYIQADPIGLEGGSNPYLYAEANPLKFIDAEGLQTAVIGWGGAIAGGGGAIARATPWGRAATIAYAGGYAVGWSIGWVYNRCRQNSDGNGDAGGFGGAIGGGGALPDGGDPRDYCHEKCVDQTVGRGYGSDAPLRYRRCMRACLKRFGISY